MKAAYSGHARIRNSEESAPGREEIAGIRLKEVEFLDEIRRASPAAVEELFDRYHPKVYSLARSILKNESDAEEVAQDVFLTVVRKAGLFRGQSALYSWIYRICVNTCLMRLRKQRRNGTVPIGEYLPVFTSEGRHVRQVEDWSRGIERRMLEKELGQLIEKYAGDLSEKYRMVFVLCDVQGFSYEEAARIMNLSIPALKSRLHRSRLYLRERLGRYLREGNT